MTITVFDIRDIRSIPEHKKPTFTDLYRKLTVVRIRISTMQHNLNNIDKALDDIHKCIIELEEVTKHE